MRILEQFDAFVGNSERPSEEKGADRVGNYDDRDESQKRVVDERPRVNRDFIEAKGEGDDGRHDCVQTEKR